MPALGLALATVAFAAPSDTDTRPPTVLALSAESRGGQFEVRVRVVDDSGPGEVLFHVRGPQDQDYRVLPMRRVEGDEFRVSVPLGGGADDWLVYYVEATDRHGNGPGVNGSADEPFHAVPAEAVNMAPRNHSGSLALLLLLPLSLLILLLYRPGRRRREEQFWIELLAPISAKPADALERAIADVCAVRHHHPGRGLVTVKPRQARRWLERLKATQVDWSTPVRERHAQNASYRQADARSVADANVEQIRETLFWFHMLQPLVNATAEDSDRELRRLAARRHYHPQRGWRIFGTGVLRARLEEVRRIDAAELLAAASRLDDPPGPPTVEVAGAPTLIPQGASLIELVVVLGILALALGLTASAFQSLEAPVRTGGALTEALLRQARARAIAQTAAHRVRPLDPDSLIVESSSKCSASAWSLEQEMTLDLPQGVTVSDTSWSVCFDSRGIASENVVVTFNHPEFSSRQLEVLRGGATRWLP